MDPHMFDGIEYPLMAGAGAVVGLIIGTPILALLGFVWPVLWGAWLFSPCAIGAVLGLLFARGAGR